MVRVETVELNSVELSVAGFNSVGLNCSGATAPILVLGIFDRGE